MHIILTLRIPCLVIDSRKSVFLSYLPCTFYPSAKSTILRKETCL